MAVANVESVTWTVKKDVPAVVGFPAIELPTYDRPAGSAPEAADHVYGVVPPVATSGAL